MKPPKTQKEQDKMFEVWCSHQSTYYVAKKCGFSETTVRKYRDKNNWIERLEKIKKKAATQNDNAEVKRRVRHVKLGQMLQTAGKTKFVDDNGKLKKRVIGYMLPHTAVKAIEVGIKVEKEALDLPSEITERTVKFEFVTPNREEEKVKENDKSNS